MNELPLHGAALVAAVTISALVGLFLQVLLFRSACDLCSIEPPGWPKSLAIVIGVGIVCGLIAGGIVLLGAAAGRSAGATGATVPGVSLVASLPIQAALAALAYMLILRVRFVTGMLVWLIQSVLMVLISAVLLLLLMGGAVVLEAFQRVL
jgi:hypothetical protein